jgi:hypothetical protein
MTNRAPVVSVRIIGGLGNQLFQLAVALHLRDVLGVPVVLDRQFYFEDHPFMDQRDFELAELAHGFPLIRGRGQSTRLRALPRALRSRIITRGAKLELIDDVSRKAAVIGAQDPISEFYAALAKTNAPNFQYATAAQSNTAALRSLLEARMPTAFERESDSPYIGVHSRLGDYLGKDWGNPLGATDPATLLELGRQLSQKHGGLPIRVFTDSPKIFKHLCPESRVGPYELSTAISSWDALTEMARSHAFVMSNSTLSWWAAFIATTYRDEPTEVLMPHPWMSHPGTWDELLPIPEWTRFERSLLSDSVDLSEFER